MVLGQCFGYILFWSDPEPDPDPRSTLEKIKRYPDFFNRRRIFKYFFTIFMLKLHEPFRDKDFLMVTFFNISYLGFERKRFSFAVFVDICTWIGILISIFLRIRIQEAKIMRIHQILILSTAWRSWKHPLP